MPSLQQLLEAIDSLAPWDLADSWDQAGLQVGSRNQTVKRVLVAVDLNQETLNEAIQFQADGLVVHHPLLFKPITQIDYDTPTGRFLQALIQNHLFLVAAHTNVDRALGGLNQELAALFSLKEIEILEPDPPEDCKIVVFTPEDYVERVRRAMAEAGAGVIGNYRDCSFELQGKGTFTPGAGAQPFIGKPGNLETVSEIRLEIISRQRRLPQVIKALMASHPYEEPAFDIYPLLNKPGHGLGVAGQLPQKMTLRELCGIVAGKLQAKSIRVLGAPESQVGRLAICSGNGGGLIPSVVKKGAEVYLTGELNYHGFLLAKESGLAVIEAGHWTTEKGFISLLTRHFQEYFKGLPDFEVIPSATTITEPFVSLT
ncbi:MAG: Nif3-like dinuclear metal center hexameric protein [Firmicutes bacterium]|nr:Nif3-like dinuclear metal center hexameric protein [Bacillota bacterium]